jgi:hypothetical protein
LEERAYYYSLEGLGGEIGVHGFEVDGRGRELNIVFQLEHTTRLVGRSLLSTLAPDGSEGYLRHYFSDVL